MIESSLENEPRTSEAFVLGRFAASAERRRRKDDVNIQRIRRRPE